MKSKQLLVALTLGLGLALVLSLWWGLGLAPMTRAAEPQHIPSGVESLVNEASVPFNQETFTYTIYLPLVFGCPSLYSDNFSDPESGWPSGDRTYSLYEYLNDEYRILRIAAGWAGARPWSNNSPDFKATDCSVAADVRNATGVNGSYGLLFGISDDWSQFYTFEIFPNGRYEIWRGGYNATGTMLASGSSGEIKSGTASNRLRVERNGSLIEVYANDQLLRSVADSSYTGPRQVGLIVSSYGSEVDVRFDNFVACSANAGALTWASQTSDFGGGVIDEDLPDKRASSNPNRKSN